MKISPRIRLPVIIGVIIIIMLIVAPVALANNAIDRATQAEFDGDIDYLSLAGSPVGESVIQIKGTGQAVIDAEYRLTSETFQADLFLSIMSGPDMLDAIVGTRSLIGNTDSAQVYVTRALPGDGEAATIEHDFFVEENTFPVLSLHTEAIISQGIFQRYIDLKQRNLMISEVFRVVGRGWVKDAIRFAPDDEVQ